MIESVNEFITKYITRFELVGVLMRISSFSVVSYMGATSPFLLVWSVNTLDAVILTWCSVIKKDRAYSLLNFFWVLVSIFGIYRSF